MYLIMLNNSLFYSILSVINKPNEMENSFMFHSWFYVYTNFPFAMFGWNNYHFGKIPPGSHILFLIEFFLSQLKFKHEMHVAVFLGTTCHTITRNNNYDVITVNSYRSS